eukprot:Sro1411_g270410.1 n/a (331) ;mRNA; r:21166-22158
MAHDLKHMEGAPALLKHMAQLAFYSRAGNASQIFLPHMTNAELYQRLLPWVYWTRDVAQINNPREATFGAVWARALALILDQGHLHRTTDEDEDANSLTTVTIVVGHDGDLDAIATALGVRWKAPPPYQPQSAEYLVTPPVSGIHAKHTIRTGIPNRMDMSFLCPVYSMLEDDEQDDAWVWNSSGILEQSPLIWRNSKTAARWKTSSDGVSTYLEGENVIDSLQQQVLQTLAPYTGATTCWEATESFLLQQEQTLPPLGSTTSMLATSLAIVGWSLLGLCAAAWFWTRRRLGGSAYTGIQSHEDDDEGEGVFEDSASSKVNGSLQLAELS